MVKKLTIIIEGLQDELISKTLENEKLKEENEKLKQ